MKKVFKISFWWLEYDYLRKLYFKMTYLSKGLSKNKLKITQD